MINININKNSNQSGRSMIEMLGVLAIVGVLSVGGIAGYSKAMEMFKINKTAEQVSQIVTNIRTLYAQQTTYDGLNTTTAIQMGAIPDGIGSGSTITNAFSGQMSIHSNSSLVNQGAFAINSGQLTKNACITLATMDWGTISSSGLIAIAIGEMSDSIVGSANNCTSGYQGRAYVQCSKDGPLNVSLAATHCVCSNEYNCKIMWKFQ